MAKAKVAVLKCTPETILSDIERLVRAAGMKQALAAGKTTILKETSRGTTHSQAPTPRPGRWRAPSMPCVPPGTPTSPACKTRRW